MCETQRIWRLDRRRTVPWWTTWHEGDGIIAQCTCMECPETDIDRLDKLQRTVEESIWDNGQVMLVDIARRAGLKLGPNRRMQELMQKRNDEILAIINSARADASVDVQISEVNTRYAQAITNAARRGPDANQWKGPGRINGGKGQWQSDNDDNKMTWIVIVACSFAILACIVVATWMVLRKKAPPPVLEYQNNQHVVVGNPVCSGTDAAGVVQGSVPTVTVAAVVRKSPTNGDRDKLVEEDA